MRIAASPSVRKLSRTGARRLAIIGQRLAGERPPSVVEAVKALGKVQIDPTSVVDRAERLVLWSRLGSYDREDLRRALEEEPRQLFEYAAILIPVDDMPLHRPVMQRYPRPIYSRGGYVSQWLDDNAGFRAYVLDELRASRAAHVSRL